MITWDETRLEAEFESLMAEARKHLRPEWKSGEVIVLKTAKGTTCTVEIPDFADPAIREPLENQCIQSLTAQGDTEVLLCLATISGDHPEIPSWNFRSGLVAADPRNLETLTFLWGGNDVIYAKPFRSLLPPEKK